MAEGDVARDVGGLSNVGKGIVPPARGLRGGETGALRISAIAALCLGDPMGVLSSEVTDCLELIMPTSTHALAI